MLLSLDVGFKNTGWTVFDNGHPVACGCIITEKSKKKSTRTADDNAFRAAQLARKLKEIIGQHQCKAIIGELPGGGAQNAKAMAQMNMATAIVSAVASLLELPAEWCTPNDVKMAVTGLKSGTKQEIMDTVSDRYGWEKQVKIVKNKKGKINQQRQTFFLFGVKYPSGVFEHIADSIGAYWALADGNMVKMFG